MKKLDDRGFTMIELLIAMAFFSFLLLFVTFGFVQINRAYTKGITVKTIQDSSRILIEDITREVRVSDDVTFTQRSDGSQNGYRLCFPGVRYAWNQQLTSASETSYLPTTETYNTSEEFTIIKSVDTAACTAEMPFNTSETILDERATIQHLAVVTVAPGSFRIVLVVSTREAINEQDLDAFGENARCKVQVGDQFCDVAKFETIATVR